ncbi:geminin-like [Plakobranchus ocellatus]|uniref:Geminin-like n=1 Tax=Plakobranchus ocellatus TaxID=259542 RepID=A0AAV4AD91_9GAST|nr:geminin-like [Plakobranchus ocellatus]
MLPLIAYQQELQERPERRSLQTLQASPNGNGLNGGKDYLKDLHNRNKTALLESDCLEKQKVCSQTKGLSVYHDHVIISDDANAHYTRSTQTEVQLGRQCKDKTKDAESEDSAYFDQEAFDLMANENIPETYWKDLAEERRRALEESLDENRRLSLENHQLKEENQRLLLIAQEAKELRELLEGALTDDEDSAITLEVSKEAEQSFGFDVKTEEKTHDADSKIGMSIHLWGVPRHGKEKGAVGKRVLQ